MDDCKIIALYNDRDEAAIRETDKKYGRMLHTIAYQILSDQSDSEEIVNDTYGRTWESIPPERPNCFSAYIGRITRNLSINRWQKNRAQKRYNGPEAVLSELEDCIPQVETVESEVECNIATGIINNWLGTLERDDRVLFLRRYWFCDSVNDLAHECNVSQSKMAGRLYRLRQKLRSALESEGIVL